MKNLVKILMICFVLMECISFAQNKPFDGFHFQAILLDPNGLPYNNATLPVKAEISYSGGSVVYHETNNVVTNYKGYVELTVGGGSPISGAIFNQFNQIVWKDTSYHFTLYLFNSQNSTYSILTQKKIQTSLFSLYSKSTLQKYRLNELMDVDTSGLVLNSVLKWNGVKWIAASDSLVRDSVNYATNTNHSVYADTSQFALNAQNIIPSDTAVYAFLSDSSQYSTNSGHSIYSDTSSYSNYAGLALNANNVWKLTGNLGTNPASHFVGTNDANDLKISTNDTCRMIVKSNGRIGIGTTTPNTDLHVIGSNGFVFNGTLGAGVIPTTGAGTRVMWFPKKAAFRGGTLDAGVYSAYWDDNKTGNYSFAFGRNVEAGGISSMAMGEDNHSLANYSGTVGSGNYVYGGGLYSFAAGHGNTIFSQVSFALGRGNVCRGLASGALGYHSEANGDYSRSFGFYTYADGDYSTSMGYQCKALHDGCFIYNDYSAIPGYLTTSAANQFMAKAAGGFYFYTNSTSTVGATLAPGSGSWSTLSDSTMKENFQEVQYQAILNEMDKLEIYKWNYKTQNPSIVHMGPTAQSFYARFHLGETNTAISTVDADGVNLAAIKALIEKAKKIEKLSGELAQALEEVKRLKAEAREFEQKLLILESSYEQYTQKGR